MKYFCAAALVAVLLQVSDVQAQTRGATFEVASIKPSPSGGRGRGFGVTPAGQFMAQGMTVADLVGVAYGSNLPLRRFQITGGPGWLDADRFDIAANSPIAAPTGEQMAAMIRALLIERFKLVARQETKDAPIYLLNLARQDGQLGPKLKSSGYTCFVGPPPDPGAARNNCVFRVGYGELTGRGVSMPTLAYSIQNFYGIGRLVVDRTGLVGGYDMDMEWAPLTQFRQPGNLDPPSDAADRPVNSGPTIFIALKDQLGLSLDSSRGPVPTVVIERIEKPTPD
jgi:uncharacterized protein (TIGR03435 family)